VDKFDEAGLFPHENLVFGILLQVGLPVLSHYVTTVHGVVISTPETVTLSSVS